MRTKAARLTVGLLQAAAVVAFLVAIGSRAIPLGVPGEWEWERTRFRTTLDRVIIAAAAGAGFVGFAVVGLGALRRKPSIVREAAWVLALIPASIGVQVFLQEGAPEGYGLSKWVFSLYNAGSSGYYTVAKEEIREGTFTEFVKNFPEWIKKQDALHIGTHPPGLFLVSGGLLKFMRDHRDVAEGVMNRAPFSVREGFKGLARGAPIPVADQAALTVLGALTLVLCASTVAPLYLLVRSSLAPAIAWQVACLWPLVPAGLMFQPTSDTAFPFVSVAAVAFASWAARRVSRAPLSALLAVMSGVLLGVGMVFSLVFLAVGFITALATGGAVEIGRKHRLVIILWIGVGFGLVVLAWAILGRSNPLEVWWWNQRNHARFYEQFPRSYWVWMPANLIETAVSLGLPTSILMCLGFRAAPRETLAAAATLLLLTVTGRSLSEVARLWIPMLPFLLPAAGMGFDKLDAGRGAFAWTAAWVIVQVLGLETAIQVVYPA